MFVLHTYSYIKGFMLHTEILSLLLAFAKVFRIKLFCWNTTGDSTSTVHDKTLKQLLRWKSWGVGGRKTFCKWLSKPQKKKQKGTFPSLNIFCFFFPPLQAIIVRGIYLPGDVPSSDLSLMFLIILHHHPQPPTVFCLSFSWFLSH